jgi:hypothetical protein
MSPSSPIRIIMIRTGHLPSGDAYAQKGGRVHPSRSGTVKLIVK